MTVRPDYSLSHARYTPFLFTAVGTETAGPGKGEEITVLTALSRMGVDPWREAARLADLPRDAAAEALAATFVNLPDTRWAEGDAAGAALRLVDTLPKLRRRVPAPVGPWILLNWRFWIGIALLLALVGLHALAGEIGRIS
jgi:hypothetical protein